MDLDNAACAQLTIWHARTSTPRRCRRRPSQNASLPRASYFSGPSGHVGAVRAARGGVLATFEKIDKKEISWGARQGTVAHAGPHGTTAARGHMIDSHASSGAPAMGFGVSSGILAAVDEHSGRSRSCSGPKKRSDRAVVSSGVASSRPTTTGGTLTPSARIWASPTRRLPTATMMAIRVSPRGPKADIHTQPSPGRRAGPKTDVKTVPSRVAGPRAAPPKSSLFFVGLLLRGPF